MKIDLNDMKKYMIGHLVGEKILSFPEATKVVEALITSTEEKLLCHNCNGFLADKEFYKSKGNPSRRHRQTMCKGCHKLLYR